MHRRRSDQLRDSWLVGRVLWPWIGRSSATGGRRPIVKTLTCRRPSWLPWPFITASTWTLSGTRWCSNFPFPFFFLRHVVRFFVLFFGGFASCFPFYEPRFFSSTVLGFTEFYRVLQGLTEFRWVVPSLTGFYSSFVGFIWVLLGFTRFHRVLLGFHWILLGFTGFFWVLSGFTWFYLVLPGLTGFYRVLLGSTRFHWVWMIFFSWFCKFNWIFTGLYWVLIGFSKVSPGFTGFYWVSLRFTGYLLGFI